MTNGSNGSKISKETLIPVSLFLIAITFVATIAMSWQARTSDIETLKEDVAKLEKQRDADIQRIANYRAQVDGYRLDDSKQENYLLRLDKRLAKLED